MKQRIYLVGAGAIACHHARAIANLPVSEHDRPLLYVTDVNRSALADFIDQFPWATPVDDLAAMLSEPAHEDDIVIIATPPSTHADLACRALRSGRHALCEKPLAMDREEAALMLRTAKETGKLLGCCSSRFAGLPTTLEVKAQLSKGRLGKLYRVQWTQRRKRARSGIEYQPNSRWFLNKSISGGGTLMDWGPYDMASLTETLQPTRVDVLHAWMAIPATGHPLEASAPSDVEQHVGALLKFHLPNGSTVPVHYDRAACCHGEERSTTEIEGTGAAIDWDWLCLNGGGELRRHGDLNGEPTLETVFMENRTPDMMDKPIVYFLQAVAGLDSPAIVNEQAVFNFGILASIYACIQTGTPQSLSKEGFR